jgi:hypothetical protein
LAIGGHEALTDVALDDLGDEAVQRTTEGSRLLYQRGAACFLRPPHRLNPAADAG